MFSEVVYGPKTPWELRSHHTGVSDWTESLCLIHEKLAEHILCTPNHSYANVCMQQSGFLNDL